MDRETREWLQELKRLRNVDWKPGEQVMGLDVHFLIDTLEGLCRCLPGQRGPGEKGEAKILSRLETRRETRRLSQWVDQYLAVVDSINDSLRAVTDGILISLGFRRYGRREWQLSDQAALEQFRRKVDPMNQAQAPALTVYAPPPNDVEAIQLFSQARNGDPDAIQRVRRLIQDRQWITWLGDLGLDATMQLLANVAEGDPVSQVAITEHIQHLAGELLGEEPTALERLLVRSVINGWIAVHRLTLELAVRPPAAMDRQRHLDQSICRAHRRYLDAVRELTHVRRSQAPRKLKKLSDEGEVQNLIPMKKGF